MENNNQSVILIVDDMKSNILALQGLLEKEDREFLTAGNGSDALRIALTKDIDLIILDVQMAEMDGFEVAHLLKQNNKTREIPIIFASAVNKEYASVLKGFAEGAVDYLSKPLDPEITKAKVAILLKMQKQKKELVEKNRLLEKSAILINNSADILGVMDGETLKFEQVNPAFQTILGYSPDEVIGASLSSFLDREHSGLVQKIFAQQGERKTFETPLLTLKGELKWFQWNVTVKDHKWFFNARDITSKKEADDRIKDLNKDLEENLDQLEGVNRDLEAFSYSVSHDLRAPLRSIYGYGNVLKEDHSGNLDEDGRATIEKILRNAQKMGKLIDDLLAFSKLGRKEVSKTEINMNDLINEVLREVNSNISHKATVQVNPLPAAQADRFLLTQVWVNLFSNAIKYSSKAERPEVEIGALEEDQKVVYYIKDNGVGFDMEYVHKLFNVFERLHASSEFEGTGIGLATIQRIISRHGGKIWAEGKVNQGATFFFSLG